MAASTDIKFSSECGRILQAEAFNLFNVINVSVGSDGVQFPVYEAVVRNSSKFFENAMKPEWANARPNPRVIDLSDEDPKIFKVYLHWIYYKTIPSVHTTVTTKWNPEYVQLSKCYVLGEKLMDTAFQNAILTALADSIVNQPFYRPRCPGSQAISIIYEGTLEGASVRGFLVDLWVEAAGESWLNYLNEGLHHAFVLEFSRALLLSKCQEGQKDKRSWRDRIKNYHEK